MTTPELVINLDPASLAYEEQKNAFAILSNLPSLLEFNKIKTVLGLTTPNILGDTTLSTFLEFCRHSKLDLSNEGVREFKANHPPLDPNKPILGNTAAVYYQALGFQNNQDRPWMEFAKAELAAGVKETAGRGDNSRIVEYHQSTTLPPEDASQDETSWCSSFVNWCMMKANIKRTGNAMARSWLNWGEPLTTPKYGCIVVLWRETPSSSSGHVGFFVKQEGDKIVLLGGNQSDAVTQASYPKSRVLGYRWPKVSDR